MFFTCFIQRSSYINKIFYNKIKDFRFFFLSLSLYNFKMNTKETGKLKQTKKSKFNNY